jgi:hypothetical protein
MIVSGQKVVKTKYNGHDPFPYEYIYPHQQEFIHYARSNILMASSTCSGKTAAFLTAAHTIMRKSNTDRYITLYLVPTRLLANSQLSTFHTWAKNNNLDCTILQPGLTTSHLTHRIGNHLVVSSPDIIFYMLLRKSRGWKTAFELTFNQICAVCFDEVHLYDDYTLYNIHNLIHAIQTSVPDIPVWFLTATADLGKHLDLTSFRRITGSGTTFDVQTKAVDINSSDLDTLEKWLRSNNYLNNTVLVLNSAQKAKRLKKRFPDAALLVGRIHYDPQFGDPEEQLGKELEKCRQGAFTIATSVFRQGVDLEFDRLVTEEPDTAGNAIQTFGRCGRKQRPCEFIVITGKSPVKTFLNQDISINRPDFESDFAAFYRPVIRQEVTRLAKACWYKLYLKTTLQEFIQPGIDEEMIAAYQQYEPFLPDVSFRDPMPALDSGNDQVGLFDILAYRGAHHFIKPHDSSRHRYNTVGFFTGRSKLAAGELAFASAKERPVFYVNRSEKIPGTDLDFLELQFNDIRFSVNARTGKTGDFPWRCLKQSWRSGRGIEMSFQPSMLGC